jgi:hypothetical protein
VDGPRGNQPQLTKRFFCRTADGGGQLLEPNEAREQGGVQSVQHFDNPPDSREANEGVQEPEQQPRGKEPEARLTVAESGPNQDGLRRCIGARPHKQHSADSVPPEDLANWGDSFPTANGRATERNPLSCGTEVGPSVRAIVAYAPGLAILVAGVAILSTVPFAQPGPYPACPSPSGGPPNCGASVMPGTSYDILGPLLIAVAGAYTMAVYGLRSRRRRPSIANPSL